jgi:hypothetical protein
MRSRASKYKWQVNGEWHRKFAWLPVHIPEATYDSIKVPAMWIWLERYDRRRTSGFHGSYWERRPFTGSPSIRQLRYA